jgi:general nucleoside transport system permease protein
VSTGARADAPKVGMFRSERLESAVLQAGALALAFTIALVAGALIVIAYGQNPLEVYGAILEYGFGSLNGLGYVLAIATPLIFSGLAVSVCFKAGLFNIGVEGQFLVGMVTASWAALNLDFLPGGLHVVGVLLFASLGGMMWAAVPAILKVRTGAHEVVTTIMMNGIAIGFVGWALNYPLRFQVPEGQNADLRTEVFPPTALVGDMGRLFGITRGAHLSWLLLLGIALAFLIWFLIRRTRLGYEARAVGISPGSARAGGISIAGIQVKLFLLSGSIAGLVGMQQILADRGYLGQNYLAQLGFIGIGVAFLAQNNAIGIIFAAILWGLLSRGETALQIETDVPREFIIILQGILIMSVVIVYQVVKRRLARRQLARAGQQDQQDAAAPVPAEPAEEMV